MNLLAKIIENRKRLFVACLLLLLILMYFPLFGHLGSLPLSVYDEARLANNAYEMHHNGNWLVTYYNGAPDMWNTKPPLMIWMQVIFMKLMGVSDISARMPAAMAGVLTCLALLYFSKKILKRRLPGFVAVMVLITSLGYIASHVTRTADYDALLVLFTTIMGLSFFLFCETDKPSWLYTFFVALILAALTKGVTCCMFFPALMIYGIGQKKILPLFKNKHLYIGIGSFLFIVGGYYLLRNYMNPGYLQAVWNNELGGRYFATNEGHDQPFEFYYDNLVDHNFKNWFLVLLSGIMTGLFSNNDRIKKLTFFSFVMALTYFLIISCAKTKLDWYDAPVYPYISIIAGMFIVFIYDLLKTVPFFKQRLVHNIIPLLFVCTIFYYPYRESYAAGMSPQTPQWMGNYYDNEFYIKHKIPKHIHDLDNVAVITDGYSAHTIFYIKMLKDRGVHIHIANREEVKAGDTILLSDQGLYDSLSKNYILKPIDSFKTAKKVAVVSPGK